MQQSPFQGISAIGSSLGASGAGSASGIGSIGSIGSISSPLSPSNVSEEDGKSFGEMLGGALSSVNQSQDVAKTMTQNLMNGKLENIHEMTIAGAKAEVMMKLTTQITGKLSQATTQLFQMQI
jgi:flagellar hook-basal body complex protein FliE